MDRTLDRDPAHLGRLHNAINRIVVQNAAAVGLVQEKMRNVGVRDEGKPHVSPPGFDGHAYFVFIRLDIGDERDVPADLV